MATVVSFRKLEASDHEGVDLLMLFKLRIVRIPPGIVDAEDMLLTDENDLELFMVETEYGQLLGRAAGQEDIGDFLNQAAAFDVLRLGFFEPLIKAQEDPSPRVRERASWALTRISR